MSSSHPSDLITDFQHIAVLVSDLEVSKRWYAGLLGWTELFTQKMPSALGDLNGFTGCGGRISMGRIHGTRVELVEMHTETPLRRWAQEDRLGLFLLSVRVTDLTPLAGMPLEMLNLNDVPVTDLTPLASMTRLRSLNLHGTPVSDLGPLSGLKLTELSVGGKQVTDLSPLAGMPLARLQIFGTSASDLTPLAGMPLEELRFTPQNITQGLDILRALPVPT